MKSVVIIGAGIGGLCTGIELQLRGYKVCIYEKNEAAGGVLRSITSPDGSFRFEESASIAINPNTYHDYLRKLGMNSKKYFCNKKLKDLYHVYFQDGSVFHVPHNLRAMREILQKNFPRDLEGWEKFMKDSGKKFKIARRYFIKKPFMTVSSILKPEQLCKLLELNPFYSARHYVNRYIKSEKLRDFILFQAFFMGVEPKKLPNVYTTVYTNSQIEGISHIQGGLSHYAAVLAQIFEEKGGKIYYNTPVQKILGKGSFVTGIRVGNQIIKSNIVVVNADYCYAQKELLSRRVHRPFQQSCSTYIVHLGLRRKYPQLGVHNLFINKHFEEEIAGIFKGRMPKNPSLYIYSPSIADDSYCKNPSHSVMNLMLRVPNLQHLPIAWDEAAREQLYELCLSVVSSIKGLENIKDDIVYKRITTPNCFEARYNCQHGSCFGIGHTLFQSMALRPQQQDKVYKNLYYVGSSIHPGNGASIVMEGAQILSETICRNHPI